MPRAQIDPGDFDDLWLVFDYGPAPGHYAIHMRNVLSTGGLQVRAQDRENARWPFEFTAHYLADAVDGAVFEVWIAGDDESVKGKGELKMGNGEWEMGNWGAADRGGCDDGRCGGT